MRLFLSLSLLVALAGLSGCFAPDGGDLTCPPSNNLGRVVAIEGATIRVQVLQPGPGAAPGEAVLHTEGAEFYSYAGSLDECHEQDRGMLTTGQEIQFFVDSWKASQPPQANVDAVVVLG